MTERAAIHAFLSPEAKTAWDDFSAEHGVTLSAILEVAPDTLLYTEGATKAVQTRVADTVTAARKVDATRRRRGR